MWKKKNKILKRNKIANKIHTRKSKQNIFPHIKKIRKKKRCGGIKIIKSLRINNDQTLKPKDKIIILLITLWLQTTNPASQSVSQSFCRFVVFVFAFIVASILSLVTTQFISAHLNLTQSNWNQFSSMQKCKVNYLHLNKGQYIFLPSSNS